MPALQTVLIRVPDSIWGVIDFEPDTDLPDIRNQTFVHAEVGTLFIIPRERDLVRFYLQISADATASLVDPATGRVDKDRTSPEKLIERAQEILRPYKISVKDGRIEWWTIYVGACRPSAICSVDGC